MPPLRDAREYRIHIVRRARNRTGKSAYASYWTQRMQTNPSSRYFRFVTPFLVLGLADGLINAVSRIAENHYFEQSLGYLAVELARSQINAGLLFALLCSTALYGLVAVSPLRSRKGAAARFAVWLCISVGFLLIASRIFDGHDWSAKMVSIGIWRGWYSETMVLKLPLPLIAWRWIDGAYHQPLATAATALLLPSLVATLVALAGRRPRTMNARWWLQTGLDRLFVAALAVVVAVGAIANLAAALKAPQVAARPANVIWISWDSTRADHLSCYGYAKPTTPSLDGFAEQAVLFESAFAQHNWTRPSYASMFTGLYKWDIPGTRLDPGQPTLTEILKNHGYKTIGFSQNPNLDAELGFDQGFDSYVQLPGRSTAGLMNHFALKAVRDLAGSQEPFFLFIQYQEPHWPYRLDSGYVNQFAGSQEVVGQDEIQDLMWHHGAGWDPAQPGVERKLAYISGLYDADLRATDEALGELLRALRADQDLWANSLVIFNADHGDELGERGGFGHGHMNLYAELTRVPLLIRFPDAMGIQPRRYRRPVQGVDLFPTVLDVAGIELPQHLRGRSLVELADAEAREGYAVSFQAELVSVRDAMRTVVVDGRSGRVERYHRGKDPAEMVALAATAADAGFAELEDEAKRLSAQSLRRLAEQAGEADPAMREDLVRRLRALGYLQ